MNKFISKMLTSCAAILLAIPLPLAVEAQSNGALDDPIPKRIRQRGARIRLESVAEGLTAPNWGTSAPGDSNHLFVTDQTGMLWAINLTSGDKTVLLNVTDRLVELGVGGPNTFDERGLLGVAFHPSYAENGLLYTYTSETVTGQPDFSTIPAGTEANHQSVITEWQATDPNNPTLGVTPGSARVLLRIDQPQFNHNGGALSFGADGLLYIALGDGGAGDDQGDGHTPNRGNGQDPSNVLGSILRIDPTGANAPNGQYSVPPDNPFVDNPAGQPLGGQNGCLDGFCDEIFAYGFRNPFRIAFDIRTGDLYAGDVGQNDIEEVDIVIAGGNYGWPIKEGSFCFDANGTERGFVTDESDCGPLDLIDPVAEYDHDEGVAVIGGFVYRGRKFPTLRGRYVFGDNTGRLFLLRRKELGRRNRISLAIGRGIRSTSKIAEFRLLEQDDLGLSLLGFGQDTSGELYVLGNTNGVPFGETGVVLRIAPARRQRSRW